MQAPETAAVRMPVRNAGAHQRAGETRVGLADDDDAVDDRQVRRSALPL